MKLGLLVVLTVAVLLPSLSDGRTATRCELRDKLREAISLPRRLQKFKDQILEIVICKLEASSHLKTDAVKAGDRKQTTETKPASDKPLITQRWITELATTKLPATEPLTSQPLTTKPPTTAPTGNLSVNVRQKRQVTATKDPETQELEEVVSSNEGMEVGINDEDTETDEDQVTQDDFITDDDKETDEDEVVDDETGTDEEKERNIVEGMKGDVITDEDKEIDEVIGTVEDKVTNEDEETVEEKDTDEVIGTDGDKDTDEVIGTDGDKEGDVVDGMENDVITNKVIDTDGDNRSIESKDNDEDGETDEGKDIDEDEETGRSRTGLGYYGLFQLSDRYSCDPGSGWSFNKCNTDCDAFIDDNIMDDIDCFVNSGAWLSLLKKPIGQCHRNKNFFDKCE